MNNPIIAIDPIDEVQTAGERVQVAVVSLPPRLDADDDDVITLVRLRVVAQHAVVSTRLGPRQLHRLIVALQEAYSEAYPGWAAGERVEPRGPRRRRQGEARVRGTP